MQGNWKVALADSYGTTKDSEERLIDYVNAWRRRLAEFCPMRMS